MKIRHFLLLVCVTISMFCMVPAHGKSVKRSNESDVGADRIIRLVRTDEIQYLRYVLRVAEKEEDFQKMFEVIRRFCEDFNVVCVSVGGGSPEAKKEDIALIKTILSDEEVINCFWKLTDARIKVLVVYPKNEEDERGLAIGTMSLFVPWNISVEELRQYFGLKNTR